LSPEEEEEEEKGEEGGESWKVEEDEHTPRGSGRVSLLVRSKTAAVVAGCVAGHLV
jgi:hypothetical protein